MLIKTFVVPILANPTTLNNNKNKITNSTHFDAIEERRLAQYRAGEGLIARRVCQRKLRVANPKHIADVKVAVEMFGQHDRNEADEFKDVEIDHIACDAGVRCVVPWIADGLDHRILRILAVPRISENYSTEWRNYSHGQIERVCVGEDKW